MMKNLNIGIAVIAISLALASCGNSIAPTNSETQSNQSDNLKLVTSSEQTEISEQTSSEIPVSSAITEKDVTSKAVAKTESSSISSRSDAVSRASSKVNVSSQASVSSSPTSSKITAADSEWIANRVLELINAERTKLGHGILSTAPKAHEIATVRAQQLTTFFSHEDELGNNPTAILYHKYKYNPNATSEFTVYDKDGNYQWYQSYGPGGSENICLTGTSGGTKEIAANNVYQMFKGSSAHWSDITKAEYTGVGVGIVVK